MARIIVCDDDDAFSGVVGDYLQKSGHVVARCSDANQLAALLQREYADLLIVDMQMPGGGGPAIARLLAASPTPPPVIVCSGMPAEAQKQWFPLARARFLQKPVKLDALGQAAGELLSGR